MTRRNYWAKVGLLMSILTSPIPIAQANTIVDVLENDNRIVVRLNEITCQPRGTPNASCTFGGLGSSLPGPGSTDFSVVPNELAITRLFTSFDPFAPEGQFAVVFTEPGTNQISDYVLATPTSIGFGFVQSFFTFASDPEGTGVFAPPSIVNVLNSRGLGIEESVGLRDITTLFRDATGALMSIPNDLTIRFASDLEPPPQQSFTCPDIGPCTFENFVPEPSTLSVFGAALVLVLLFGSTRFLIRARWARRENHTLMQRISL